MRRSLAAQVPHRHNGYVEIRAASDHSVLVSFGESISGDLQEKTLRLFSALRGLQFRNIHPGYASVLVSFDPLKTTHAEVERQIEKILGRLDAVLVPEPRHIEIPVSYGGVDGPDIGDVAALNGMSAEEVIRIHSSAEYRVFFLGFSPGFPYLGGMPESIAAPRLSTPRPRVPAGSIAIGGRQTGIYPLSSPGGWRIIGRTPLELFRPDGEPPTLLQMGDRVRFRPVCPPST
jgi:KipI family sensor histidine kinase inhibitor